MFYDLPVDVRRLIYEYDNTYREYFSQNVLPQIETNFWAKLFYRLTRGVEHGSVVEDDLMDFLNEEWDNVSDFSEDEDDEEDYQNLLL